MHYSGPDKASGADLALRKVSQLMFDGGACSPLLSHACSLAPCATHLTASSCCAPDVDLSKVQLLPAVMWRAFASYMLWFMCTTFFIMTGVGAWVRSAASWWGLARSTSILTSPVCPLPRADCSCSGVFVNRLRFSGMGADQEYDEDDDTQTASEAATNKGKRRNNKKNKSKKDKKDKKAKAE